MIGVNIEKVSNCEKILVVLCLLVFALPSFSASGYYEGCNDNVKPYDDSEYQTYAQKLVKEYHAKVDRGEVECCGPNYNHYVRTPLFKYIEKHPVDYTKTVD